MSLLKNRLFLPFRLEHNNQEVMVLLNYSDLYLIKTPFGLTGWIRIKFNDDGTVISGIFLLGD